MRGGSFYLTGNQLHWLAGLLEGEGSFVAGAPSEPRIPTLAINMTDVDVLQAVAHLCGSTVASRQPRPHVKMMYRTTLCGGSAVALMQLIQPLMGIRRQQQTTHARPAGRLFMPIFIVDIIKLMIHYRSMSGTGLQVI